MITDAPPRPKSGRGRTAIAASLAGHLLILTIIGLYAPKLIYREPPPLRAVNVWLMPRVTLTQHKPIERAAPVSTQHLAAAPKAVKPAPIPSPIQSAPVSAPGKTPPGGAKPGPAPSEQGVDGGQGVRDALRTSVGCDADHIVHLTPIERERCNQSAGQMAKTAPAFVGIDPLKRGRFDDQVAADERKRAYRDGPMQEVMPACTGQGSNLGGACLPDSAITHIHQH